MQMLLFLFIALFLCKSCVHCHLLSEPYFFGKRSSSPSSSLRSKRKPRTYGNGTKSESLMEESFHSLQSSWQKWKGKSSSSAKDKTIVSTISKTPFWERWRSHTISKKNGVDLSSSNNREDMLSSGLKEDGSKNYARDIHECLDLSNRYLSLGNDAWDFLGEVDGIRVWMCREPLSHAKEHWPCVKATAVVNASTESVLSFLMDSRNTALLNRFSAGRQDIQTLGPATKVVYNRSKIPLVPKQFDFCTLMHAFPLPFHGEVNAKTKPDHKKYVILSKAVDHPQAPVTDKLIRSEVYFSVNTLAPTTTTTTTTTTAASNAIDQTEIVAINHIRYGNMSPFLIARNSVKATVEYYKKVRQLINNNSNSD